MKSASGEKRIDTASRVIKAPPPVIYQAWTDPQALMTWLPPKGMRGHLEAFDPREGGLYRMALTYQEADHAAPGKSSEHTDVIRGKFLQLVPDERIVQLVEFESKDPAFAGTMTMTWALRHVPGGTEVIFRCENVPPGIRQEDHDEGLRASLENLAAFTERED
ncbi:SRPBCC family protein [Deinococcus aluminii]|uniref:Activator of Hsp90 ATPase homologue 1/2-like C-terminal domain-containing protein n=1 Tax=Deinococcus aluminii TaxID=1656885 RepID=A0ABP9XCR6_9DEIO